MNYSTIDMLVSEYKKSGGTLPCSAKNENKENVIISEGSCDGNHYYRTDTFKSDKDVCIVHEYYADGTITEMIER